MIVTDLTPILELMQERERIITEGTLDEVIALAKEFNINDTIEHTTTPYKMTVEQIKKRLTNDKYDWTTI
jgi:hypothetical protein